MIEKNNGIVGVETKNLPTTIYLQVGENCSPDEDFDATWAVHPVNANDVPYVLHSLLTTSQETIRRMEIDKETIRKDANRLLADQKAKVDKLLGLLEKEVKYSLREMYTSQAAIDHRWQQYRADHNL